MIYDEDFTYFDISKVWIFKDNLLFNTIRFYIPCKNLDTWFKIFQYGLEWYYLNDDVISQDRLTSRYSPNISVAGVHCPKHVRNYTFE